MPLADALRRLENGAPLPRRAVALTFDDGYRDQLDVAVPLLRHLDLPATFFLVPGLLSRTTDPWWETVSWAVTDATVDSITWEGRTLTIREPAERSQALAVIAESLKRRDASSREAALAELVERLRVVGARPGQEAFLDWAGAAEIVRAGFHIGSHTSTHVILGEERLDRQRAELADSRRALQEGLGVDVSILAYPNGTPADYGPETVEAAAEAGYTHALTTQEGWNERDVPRYELRRVVMYPERGLLDLAALSRTVRTAGRLARRAARHAGRGFRRRMS